MDEKIDRIRNVRVEKIGLRWQPERCWYEEGSTLIEENENRW